MINWSNLKNYFKDLLPDNVRQLISPLKVRTALGALMDTIEAVIQFSVTKQTQRSILVSQSTSRSWPITLSSATNTIGPFAFTTLSKRTLILGEHFQILGAGKERTFAVSEQTFDDLVPGEKISYIEFEKGSIPSLKLPVFTILTEAGINKYAWKIQDQPDIDYQVFANVPSPYQSANVAHQNLTSGTVSVASELYAQDQRLQTLTQQLATATGPTDYKGTWDASTNTPNLNTYQLEESGDCLLITKSGTQTIGGISQIWTANSFMVWNGTGYDYLEGAGEALARVLALEPKTDQALLKAQIIEALAISAPIAQPLKAGLMTYRRHTSATGVDAPPSFQIAQAGDTSLSITGYTDTTAFQPITYVNTLLQTAEKFYTLTLSLTVSALNSSGNDAPAVGIGFGSMEDGVGLLWRGSGWIQRTAKFSVANRQNLGNAYAFAVGDTLKMELSKDAQGNLLLRVQKNGGAWSTPVSFTENLTGNWLVVNRGSMNYQTSILLSQPYDVIARKYTETYTQQVLEPVNQQLLTLSQGQALDRDYLNLLGPVTSPITLTQIRPLSNYAYSIASAGGTGTYQLFESWLIGKPGAGKPLNKAGFFFYKDSENPDELTSARVRVIHRKAVVGSVDEVVLDKVLTNADLRKFVTKGLQGSLSNYELQIPFTDNKSITLKEGDYLYTWCYVPDRMTHFTSATNALLASGEWNNGSSCFRAASTVSSVPTPPTVMKALPAGNSQYSPVHFYYDGMLLNFKRVKDMETDLSKLFKTPLKGYSDNTFTLTIGGKIVSCRLITSDGYDYKGVADTLLLIAHGNQQTIANIPSAAFMAFARANKISVAIINTQDQSAAPFTTNATGWGNPIVLQRLTYYQEYLQQNYNFEKAVILAGQSMGGLAMGHLAYTKPFPIKFCLSIGGVPSLKYMFLKGVSTNRRPSIRQAYGMPTPQVTDPNSDEGIGAYTQGDDWYEKNMLELGGVKYKLFDPHLWIFAGKNDQTFSNDFGGTSKYLEIRDAINRAGGFCYYEEFADLTHASATLYDKALAAGVFLKEMGIPIP